MLFFFFVSKKKSGFSRWSGGKTVVRYFISEKLRGGKRGSESFGALGLLAEGWSERAVK